MEKLILEKLNRLEILLEEQKEKPMTLSDACDYTGWGRAYLYKLTCKKEIPHYKPKGKTIYFKKQDLDAWVFKNRIEAK